MRRRVAMRYRRVLGLPAVAGLSITPSTVAVGASAGLVATAANATGAPVNVSLGVNLPNGVSVSAVSGTGGCTPRRLTRLIYCGAIGVPSGASAWSVERGPESL